VRALGVDPVHDTRETFRALCDAASRPGTVQDLPTTPGDHALLATLVDNEVTVHTRDEALQAALAAAGRYEPAPATEATVVHTRGMPAWDVRHLDRGSLEEPSTGATVVYRVDAVSIDPGDCETAVTVTGPGVLGTREVGVDLPGGELAAIAEAQSTYPRGVDAFFVAEDRVAALPRSVSLEVR
jgi:alpha-D-ribose 1-methylphosphonate 5-triphosphate synthase subunit PhnH